MIGIIEGGEEMGKDLFGSHRALSSSVRPDNLGVTNLDPTTAVHGVANGIRRGRPRVGRPVEEHEMSYQVQVRPIPAITTTVVITVFFGIFGLIPASMHSSHAREFGQATNKYWKAFWITFGIEFVLGIMFYTSVVALLF